MKIFKFGGASVRHADGIRNLAAMLQQHQNESILTVVSAMGKTTNQLEAFTEAVFQRNPEAAADILEQIKSYHFDIIEALFPDPLHAVYSDISNYFLELECLMETVSDDQDYDHLYDQIVSFGELISTKIVSHYLQLSGFRNHWIDARNFIVTDATYREAKVLWDETRHLMHSRLKPLALKNPIITQGFIARDRTNQTTTLGREGSDYSAALFAWGLEASSVSIWKDVAGVMNADPKKFPFAQKLDSISYSEAIELAYYGASVMHPKTIQPLQSAKIPLFVKSFLNPSEAGTKISYEATPLQVPCYILKESQCLIHVKSPDFNFIAEEHLSSIFSLMAEHRIRANMMQQTAISFSVCTDDAGRRFEQFIAALQEKKFQVSAQKGLQLLTIYNAKDGAMTSNILEGKSILLEQMMGGTAQYVVQES
jgi:aspartate kinase